MLEFASAGFDACVLEILMALLAGAPCASRRGSIIENTDAFTAYLTELGVTFAILPPVYLAALSRAPLPMVRTLVTAGEAPHPEDARHYAASRRYLNAYGPAECSVCISMHLVDPAEPDPIPIGRPIGNTQVVLLDASDLAVPAGVIGELCAIGPGVARGYVGGVPGGFVVHPRWGRMYRTGDLARRRPDGVLEFIGRTDDQVKIRGHRVEPEDVRRHLLAVSQVEAAAVVDCLDAHGDRALIGFFVGTVDPQALRQRLVQSLPPALVPADLVRLAALPLTPNGKVDKEALRRLPRQVEAPPESRPLSAAEQAVAQAWAEVLDKTPAAQDNFFALGGDWIKAIRVASRLRQDGFVLGVRDIFALPVLADQALQLQKAQAARAVRRRRGRFRCCPSTTGFSPTWLRSIGTTSTRPWCSAILTLTK